MATYIVTGGAGFVGSALVMHLIRDGAEVVTVDKLTYAGNLDSLADVMDHSHHHFVRLDVCDGAGLRDVFHRYRPDGVFHLAAESHVDRSIDGPAAFIATNVNGTFALLQEARRYRQQSEEPQRSRFRLVQVSTDEVFGSLGETGMFDEESRYRPSSPYAASKAAADHLARAWGMTYGLPVIVTMGSNTYGPRQFPEKLIPLAIEKALAGEAIPVYGRGEHVRDWIHVDDHVSALRAVMAGGTPGTSYTVGARNPRSNLEVVRAVCAALDQFQPDPVGPHARRITFVADRPGHDLRYAIDPSRLERDLQWQAVFDFDRGISETVRWYLDHRAWVERVTSGTYRGERLGLGTDQ